MKRKPLLKNMLVIFIAALSLSCEKHGEGSASNTLGQRTGTEPRPLEQYKPQTARQYTYSPPAFMGYTCTLDCSGHEAGYEWAEENDIDDLGDCEGNSDAFIEGCQAYAEGRQAELEELDGYKLYRY